MLQSSTLFIDADSSRKNGWGNYGKPKRLNKKHEKYQGMKFCELKNIELVVNL